MLRLLARLFVLLAFFAAGSAHAVKEYRINGKYPSSSPYTTCVNYWTQELGGTLGVNGNYKNTADATETTCTIYVHKVDTGHLYNALNYPITWIDLQCPAGSSGSATQFLGWLDSDADPDQAEISDMQGVRPLATSMCNPSGCVVEGLTPSDVYMVHQPENELSPVMLTWSGTLTGTTCTFSLEAQDDPTDRPPSGGSGTGSGGDGSGDGTGTGGGDGGAGDGGTGDGSGTGGDGTGTGGGTGGGSGDGSGTGGGGSDGSGDGSDGSGDGTGGGGTSGGGSGGDSGGDGSGDGSGGGSGGDGSGGDGSGDGSGGGGGGGGGDGDGGGDDPDNPDEEGSGSPWGTKGTDFYTPKYPDGIGSMWAEKSAAIQSSGLLGWVAGFVPSFGDGGCPTFQMPTIYGNTSTLAVPCDVWAFVKTVILITALFLARRLVFGG